MSFDLKKGDRLYGKWHRRCYEVLGKLGEGANGSVWRVRHHGRELALKIGNDETGLMSEVQVLKTCSKAQGVSLGPRLYDVDDGEWGGKQGVFYVMSRIEGVSPRVFIRQNGEDWFWVFLDRLMSQLAVLHRHGWVFGDLKPEHIRLHPRTADVRFIDFGGVTRIGHGVRQYSEMYDRASWQAGDRKAEPAYDTFAAGVLCLSLFYDDDNWLKICSQTRHVKQLYDIIRSVPTFFPYRHLLLSMLQGRTPHAEDVRYLLEKTIEQRDHKGVVKTKRSIPWVEGAFVISLLLFVASLVTLG